MKQLSVLFIALSSILFACKKSKDDDSKYFKTNVDGKSLTFRDSATADVFLGGGMTSLTISSNGYAASNPSMSIYLQTTKLLTVGTYTDTTQNFTLVAMWQQDGSSDLYRTPRSAVNLDYKHFVLHITSLENNTVRGDFNGDLFQFGDAQAAKKSASGDFYLPLQQ